MKGEKRKRPCTRGGVSTRSRKVNSNGNEPVGEEVVHEESSPVRDTSVVSLSVESESEDMSGVSSQERQPPQPLEFYFKSTEYTKTCKIQTKCYVSKTVDVIKKLKVEVKWFASHPQFRHFFHMPDEQYLKLQGMWMLLMRTICIEEEDVAWFAVNGVPIRYSMREHALISGLDCHEYPRRYLKLGSTKFKLLSMKPCNDRLKMAVLFFLDRVIRGKTKDIGPLDPFILRIVDDLEVCRTFPWGLLLKGEVHDACGFSGFVIPLEVLAFDYNPYEDFPRMCKSRFTKSSMRGYPLEDIYVALGKTKKELYESDVVARVFTKKKEKEKITFLEGLSSTSGLECSLKGLEERLWKSMEQGFSGLNGTVETKLEAMNSRMIAIEKNQRNLKKNGQENRKKANRGDYGGGIGSKENSKNAENLKEKDREADNSESDNGENGTVSSEEENEAERRRVEADAAWRKILSESENDEGKDDEENSGEPKTTPSLLSGRPKALAARKLIVVSCNVWMTRETVQIVEEEVVAKNTVEEEEAVAKTTMKEEEETVAETVVETTKVEAEAVKQMWHMVVYKSSKEMPCESKVPTHPKIHARPKVMTVKRGRPKKGETEDTPKKRGRPKKEAATLVACTPRKKKKPQWLQSPFTDVKTEDIKGPSKKRKTKA
ncbi:hypothetical protein N665_0262s0003 [Sinapis alba]|nr:hypothetical protein N665_0262s0003 [Sinapis alba]